MTKHVIIPTSAYKLLRYILPKYPDNFKELDNWTITFMKGHVSNYVIAFI